MKKRRFGAKALLVIELDHLFTAINKNQDKAELRAIAGLIRKCGKANISYHKPPGVGIEMNLEDMREIARAILRVREVEARGGK